MGPGLVAAADLGAWVKLATKDMARRATGITSFGLRAQVNGAADATGPAARHHSHDVGATDDPQHRCPIRDNDAFDAIAGENLRDLIYWCGFAHGDDAVRHDFGDICA